MHNLTPKQLSLRLALAIALITMCIGTLFWIYFLPFNFYFSTIVFLVIFLTSYLILLQGIRFFIERKLDLIFKTIHHKKINYKKDSLRVDANEDVFGRIGKEVLEWDKFNKKEIEKLEEREKYRREFLGNISHELKTPIFNIQGYVLTLLEGGLEDKKINRTFLIRAEKSINRMIDMVDDLDEISNLEANKIELKRLNFDVVNLIKEIIDSLDYKSKKKNIKIELKGFNSSTMVNADPSKISQVITNLLVNSINYGKEGGKTQINFYDLAENLLIEIKDNGRGISTEHLPRLFERFYRVDKGRSREDGGSGLGLAIVKHILEAHQQTINVRSKVDKGSTFSFTLKKAVV